MRKITYNSQRQNIIVNNLGSFSQCFSTCSWMLLSYYCKKISGDDDVGLAEYVEYIETVLGPKIENVEHPSFYFDVQAAGIKKYLENNGIEKNVVFSEGLNIIYLKDYIEKGPVIIGTKKLGGLPGGHIILIVDFDIFTDSFVVNDPFGNAATNYSDSNGDSIKYHTSLLLPRIDIGNQKCNIISVI